MFCDLQTGFAALAHLQKDQRDGAAFFVADEGEPFGLQFVRGGTGNELRHFLRFVNQIEVTAVAQRPGSGFHQIFGGAAIFPSGKGCCPAGRTTGKIGGI